MQTYDNAVSIQDNGSMTVDTFSMNDEYVGRNDQGEALYRIDGVDMTEDQMEQNAHFFAADDDDDYYDDDYEAEDSFPEVITEQLMQINEVLGGGAAEWFADELLGTAESRMDEVMRGTNQSREAIQSHAEATLHHMGAAVNMDGDMLMSELNKDIQAIRSSGSQLMMDEMHSAITDAMAGNYHEAMTRWDRIRRARQSVRR